MYSQGGTGQLALSWLHPSTEWLLASIEPVRRPDPRLGWTFVPSREGHKTVGGRTISFAFDAAGHRVRSVNEPVDPARPTILFAGESVMLGEGLNWDETIPAQVGVLMDMQSANLAVHGYATDQSYLRVESELPHVQRPVALVGGLPYLFVEFADGWRIPGDLHPNAPTARRIAMAIADRLRARPTSGHRRQPGPTF